MTSRRLDSALRDAADFLLSIFLLSCLSACPVIARAQSQVDDTAARATAARDGQNLPLAIQLYGEAVQTNPQWQEGWFYLGLLRYESNDFAQAIDAFDHLLQLKPGVAPALALRGLCEFETKAYDDALRDLEQGVAAGAANEPHNEQIIRYHFALLLTRAGRFQDAITQYQFFASQHVENPDLLLGLGLVGMEMAKLPAEIPDESRGSLEDVGRAGFAFLSGDNQGADVLFKQLFARNPKESNLYLFYGVLLFRQGPNQAIDEFRDAVASSPGNVNAHAMLAYALMLTGRYNEAEPQAEIALAADPDMAMAQLTLGRSLAESGDPKRAAKLLDEVLARDPSSLEAHMGLASLYTRIGRREDAYRERRLCLGMEK